LRPDDRRAALVALWLQSRSEAKTKGMERRHVKFETKTIDFIYKAYVVCYTIWQ